MKVTRRHGRLRLHLEPAEVELLSTLFDELETVLDGAADPGDEVLQRLYPAAYPADPAAEAEYRSLTEDSLRTDRIDRLAMCRADLAGAGEVELADPDAARRWIQLLNDLRLALGTRLEITEDTEPPEDVTDEVDHQLAVYYWLTALQGSLVDALVAGRAGRT
jgi:hypothetical protein